MNTLIIDNYDSYTQILANLIWKLTGVAPLVLKNDAVTSHELAELKFDHIVISPGPGRPENKSDFGICSDVFRLFPDIPILGVCLGHQGMGVFTGASITYSPKVHHGIQSPVTHTGHALFKDIPSPFTAMRYHSLVIDNASNTDKVEILATSSDDNQIMALKVKGKPFYGVQFHPESVGTEYGKTILKNFLNISHDLKVSHNIPVKKIPTHNLSMQVMEWKHPEQVFNGLYRHQDNAFWLDSCEQNDWSFMGTGKVMAFGNPENADMAEKEQPDSTRDILMTLKETLKNYQVEPESHGCPFQGGVVGYFSYEALDQKSTSPVNRGEARQPLAQFLLVEEYIAFYHPDKNMYYCRLYKNDDRVNSLDTGELKSRLEKLPDLTGEGGALLTEMEPASGHKYEDVPQPYVSEDEYIRSIKMIKHLIREGETYEVCLTNEFSLEARLDPFELYRSLRKVNPARYSAYFKMPESAILCSSPEGFLKVNEKKEVITQPIKGTRRLGDTPTETLALREDLVSNPKENSELLMITDLLRNDLSHVCKPGSIEVLDVKKVTEHATLLQLSSTVKGQLREECDNIDLLKACFPGGSVTGAPKKRTREIIKTLEKRKRGIYTGSLGYFSFNGRCDLNILIRTIVHTKNRLTMGAGGAIVDASDPDSEYREILLKAAPLLKAVKNQLNHYKLFKIN